MSERFHIREAHLADLPAIAAIEKAVFSDAWSARAFAPHLGPFFLVVVTDRCAGYLVARRLGREAEVLNLAVAVGERRHGVAAALWSEVRRRLGAAGVEEVYLEVRESNLPAQAFYTASGFEIVAIRPRYYRNPAEDALLLRCCIDASVDSE